MIWPSIFGLSGATRSLTPVSVWPFVRNPSIPSGATKQGRANTQLSRLLRTTEHHLLFQKKKKKNSKSAPFIATFCFNGSKTTFSTFFSSSFPWLSLWRPRKQANMPDRSSRSRRLRSLVGIRSDFTLQFVQLKIEFWSHKCNSHFG